MGGYQAAALLARHQCDILIHINSPASEDVPAHGRLSGFSDFCRENNLEYRIIQKEFGHDYKGALPQTRTILDDLESLYPGQKKGIFISSDTLANVMLNLLIRKYGTLPEDYLLVGFDNSPISREAVLPISTVGQQTDKLAYEAVRLLVEQMTEQKKRKPVPLDKPVHKIIPPILFRRETTEHS